MLEPLPYFAQRCGWDWDLCVYLGCVRRWRGGGRARLHGGGDSGDFTAFGRLASIYFKTVRLYGRKNTANLQLY